MEKIIEIKNINKKFTDMGVLKDVSFNVYLNSNTCDIVNKFVNKFVNKLEGIAHVF